MMRLSRVVKRVAVAGVVALLAAPAVAVQTWSIDPLLQYQAVLRSADDGELVDGETEITFAMFSSEDAPADSSRLWEEGHLLDVSNGLVSVVLGSLDPLPPQAFYEDEVWLAIFIDGEELEPRQQLLPVAFALRANVADHAGSAETAELADNASQLEGSSASDFVGTEGSQTISANSSDSTLQLVQDGSGAALNAGGAVRADSYEYRQTQTRVLRLSGPEFHPTFGHHERGLGFDRGVYFRGTNDGTTPVGLLIAPLTLPVGATVTEITGLFQDDDPGDSLEVRILRTSPGSGPIFSATVTSESVEGFGEVSQSLFNPLTIDLDHTYYVQVRALDDWLDSGSNLRLHGVLVTYEIDEVP